MTTTTDKKIRKKRAVRPSTRQLSPVEQAYVAELSSLHKKVKSDPYQDYLHDVGPNGTPKWTLKRKRSLTAQNLRRHNDLPSTSPTGVDFLSPTGLSEWSRANLINLLASPEPWYERETLWTMAYKKARAGLVKTSWAPWDYVSNGRRPKLSSKEMEWWAMHNEDYYHSRVPYDEEKREEYKLETYYSVHLKAYFKIPRILEPPHWQAWKHRWVVKNTTKDRIYVGPRDEEAAEVLLLAIDSVKDKPEMTSADNNNNKRTPIIDSTGLSFVRWQTTTPLARQHIADESGLSFVRWEGQQTTMLPPPRPKRKLLASSQKDEPTSKRRRSYKSKAISATVDEAGLSVTSWLTRTVR